MSESNKTAPSNSGAWTNNDLSALSEYLGANPKFLEELRSRVPKIVHDTMEEAALTGNRHAGAEDIIKEIVSMANDSSSASANGPKFIGSEAT